MFIIFRYTAHGEAGVGVRLKAVSVSSHISSCMPWAGTGCGPPVTRCAAGRELLWVPTCRQQLWGSSWASWASPRLVVGLQFCSIRLRNLAQNNPTCVGDQRGWMQLALISGYQFGNLVWLCLIRTSTSTDSQIVLLIEATGIQIWNCCW